MVVDPRGRSLWKKSVNWSYMSSGSRRWTWVRRCWRPPRFSGQTRGGSQTKIGFRHRILYREPPPTPHTPRRSHPNQPTTHPSLNVTTAGSPGSQPETAYLPGIGDVALDGDPNRPGVVGLAL